MFARLWVGITTLNIPVLKCTVRYCSSRNFSKNLKIKRLSFSDPLLSKLILRVKSKKMRAESGLILIEGKRLLQESLDSGHRPDYIFFSRLNDLQDFSLEDDVQLCKIPYKDLQIWSDLTTSPGILAICKKPKPLTEKDSCLPVTLVGDQIREPGNLGALLRNAAAAGVRRVLLTKGCVDLWDPKVLRSGCGAHFRIPVYSDLTWDEICQHISSPSQIFLATNNPNYNRFSQDCPLPDLPHKFYFSIQYSDYQNIVVVVGGETEGLSEEGFYLAAKHNGMKISIPLENGVESLNTVSAASVILFEMKKYFLRE